MKKAVEILCVTFALIGIFTVLGMVGRVERTDEIIRSMDRELYYQIRDSLKVHGEYPSDYEVAEFYLNNY